MGLALLINTCEVQFILNWPLPEGDFEYSVLDKPGSSCEKLVACSAWTLRIDARSLVSMDTYIVLRARAKKVIPLCREIRA